MRARDVGRGQKHRESCAIVDRLAGSASPHDNLGTDRPPFDIQAAVQRLLASVDPRHRIGLRAVILSHRHAMTRERRRRATKSRGEKVRLAECRGLYWRASRHRGATIELFVDAVLSGVPRFAQRFPLVHEWLLARTLFHELGHHLHATQAPEHAEPEAVAERWRRRLASESFRHLHPILSRALRVVAPVLRPLLRLVVRTARRMAASRARQ